MTLQEEIDAFHKQIRARALLMAIEWAGSASELAERIGYTRHAGGMWVKRAYITEGAARLLEKLPGFPVKASELCAGVYKGDEPARHRCESCQRPMRMAGERTGCSPSFKGLSKRAREKVLAERKKPASARKSKPKSPARKL